MAAEIGKLPPFDLNELRQVVQQPPARAALTSISRSVGCARCKADRFTNVTGSRPIFIEPLASGFGDREPGWLLGHAFDRALVHKSV